MTTSLFNNDDLNQLESKGITPEEAMRQVEALRYGFPYPNIIAPASLENGIMRLDEDDKSAYLLEWDRYLNSPNCNVVKFVPASGAASRMFKDLYNFLDADYNEPTTDAEKAFFAHLTRFAFYDSLNETCLRNAWRTVPKLIASKEYKTVVANLLYPKGLNYGNLPKGLLLFHLYGKETRTPTEEHLAEGALYERSGTRQVKVHFTVSPEHIEEFKNNIDKRQRFLEDEYCIRYEVSFSVQDSSTDTLALTPEGELFRLENGELLFRPGGHGALIRNLQETNADIVFIKNIDNVVPDFLKCDTIIYKKLIAGVLVKAREHVFNYLQLLEKPKVVHAQLMEIVDFLRDNFCIEISNIDLMEDKDLLELLRRKLDRPIRVCGMVRNQGEPGGGPFIIREADGSSSLQILESTQIDMSDPQKRAMFEQGSYFNPVDLVCSLRDYKGEPFNLESFVNPKTAFISEKSKDGRKLLALERPGLWNGAMDDWNTIFIEVPISTFAPVKTVNDLLRPEHQPCQS